MRSFILAAAVAAALASFPFTPSFAKSDASQEASTPGVHGALSAGDTRPKERGAHEGDSADWPP